MKIKAVSLISKFWWINVSHDCSAQNSLIIAVVQLLSRVWVFATPRTAGQHTRLPCPSPTPRACSNSCPLSQLCHPTISCPLSSPSPPAFNLSQHQALFQWVGSSHQVAKVLELQLQHQSFQWIARVGSFRIDWFDLLAVQGTLKSLLQHHSSKVSSLRCSAFFIVQLSHLAHDSLIVFFTKKLRKAQDICHRCH